MKIFNSDGNPMEIPGIFLFKNGLDLTKGDYVIYNNLMYLVNTSHQSGSSTPDNSELYTEYSLLNAINDSDDLVDNTNDKKLVTGTVLKSFINKFIRGIDSKGDVQVIDIMTENDFHPSNFIDTCVYKLNIVSRLNGPRSPLPLNISGQLIFKCYRSGNDVIQELLDYRNGGIFLLNFTVDDDGIPSIGPEDDIVWSNISFTDNEISRSITEVNSKITSVYNILCNMNKVGMYDITDYCINRNNRTIVTIDNDQFNLLTDVKYLELVITYNESGVSIPLQDVVRLNMIGESEDIDQYKYTVSRVVVGNTTRITLTNIKSTISSIEISKAIIVK